MAASAEKVLIAGGGPAGLTAAIYAVRAGLSAVTIRWRILRNSSWS